MIPLINLLNGLVLKPHLSNSFKYSNWFLTFNPFSYPNVYAINFNGILLVSFGSFCLKEPDAAFLGLANFPLSFLKSLFWIKTSPLISISSGKSLYEIFFGISLIVSKFLVISSPSLPSPLDKPFSKFPFFYIN